MRQKSKIVVDFYAPTAWASPENFPGRCTIFSKKFNFFRFCTKLRQTSIFANFRLLTKIRAINKSRVRKIRICAALCLCCHRSFSTSTPKFAWFDWHGTRFMRKLTHRRCAFWGPRDNWIKMRLRLDAKVDEKCFHSCRFKMCGNSA